VPLDLLISNSRIALPIDPGIPPESPCRTRAFTHLSRSAHARLKTLRKRAVQGLRPMKVTFRPMATRSGSDRSGGVSPVYQFAVALCEAMGVCVLSDQRSQTAATGLTLCRGGRQKDGDRGALVTFVRTIVAQAECLPREWSGVLGFASKTSGRKGFRSRFCPRRFLQRDVGVIHLWIRLCEGTMSLSQLPDTSGNNIDQKFRMALVAWRIEVFAFHHLERLQSSPFGPQLQALILSTREGRVATAPVHDEFSSRSLVVHAAHATHAPCRRPEALRKIFPSQALRDAASVSAADRRCWRSSARRTG